MRGPPMKYGLPITELAPGEHVSIRNVEALEIMLMTSMRKPSTP